MRYLVEKNFVQVIGSIWQPMAGPCAMEYPLTARDVANIEKFTRGNVETWLSANSGDFQSIQDFAATIGDEWVEWEREESEITFNDCMSPPEEEELSTCSDCGASVDTLILCPDGAELCQRCFDAGAH